MDPKKVAALALASMVAGAGIGRATVPTPPGPKLERICVEADGSAQIYTDTDGKRDQLLVPTDHGLAVMHRAGGKALDIVPAKLSAAIKNVVAEAGSAAAGAR